jgi:large subunit ribosomal protein L9
MKVILLDNVEGVGGKGETREVKDGFGRNFLVPRGLAMPATKANLKQVQEHAKTIMGKKEKDQKGAELIKHRLEETPVSIKKKTGLDGKLFGSVTTKDVAEAVKTGIGVEIDKRTVRLDEPIKMTGVYTVEIHLEKGITAQLKLEIEEE